MSLEHKRGGANQYDVVVIVLIALQGYLKGAAGGDDLYEVVLNLVGVCFGMGLAGFKGVELHTASLHK